MKSTQILSHFQCKTVILFINILFKVKFPCLLLQGEGCMWELNDN